MLKKNYEVEVLINGKPAKEYAHGGKIYIEGRRGTRFSIRVRNNSYSRKLFVPTVDGLSVMNGEEGSFTSSGYIVQGNSSLTIVGWRTSDTDVAEFFFSSPEGSYRQKMSKGTNLGVIGVAVFDEAYRPVPYIHMAQSQPTPSYPEWQWVGSPTTSSLGDGLCAFTSFTGNSYLSQNVGAKGTSNVRATCSVNAGSASTQALGTGWGEQKHSEVISVEFDRADAGPDVVFEIHYNTRQELEKAGVNFNREPVYVTAPNAFPGQWCKPPKDN